MDPEQHGTDTPDLRDEVPAEIRDQLSHLLQPGEQIELAVACDVRRDGRFGEAWLLATDQQLIGYSPDSGDDSGHDSGQDSGGPPDLIRIPLVDVSRIELRDLAGSGALRVRTPDRGETVARFSRTLVHDFADLPGKVEALVRRARTVADDEQIAVGEIELGGGHRRCQRCGRVIPRRWGVCPACLETRKLLLRFVGYVRPYWRIACLSLLMMTVATAIGLSPQLLMRTLIDDVLVADPERQPTWLAGFMEGSTRTVMLHALVVALLLVHLVRNAIGAGRRYLLSYLGQHVTLDLRNEVYRHLNRLSLSFYNERDTGRIMASITQDAGRLQDFISDGLQEIIRDVLTIVIICIILFALNPTLALLVLLPTPLLVAFTLHFGTRLRFVYRALWRRWAGISTLLADTIPGVRVVKAFAQEQREVGKFETRSRDVLRGELRAARLQSVFTPTMAFITSLGNMIIWWVGGEQVLGEALSLGTFTAFTGYMWQFYGPVEGLCRLNHRFQRAASSAERVFETLDAQPDVVGAPGAKPMPRIVGRIEFRDVTFAYGESKPVLRHIDLDVTPGEMIGLAGHSGAGKSTLINLICRFYDVSDGQIRIDGHDIRDVELKTLRDQIGVVLQDPFLFNGTLADNISYGNPHASLDEVVASARAAHAHDFIMDLPDGYDTITGERGVRLSGGERQRISIARAILRDPRILILDEATSSVDTETEVEIQEALERLIKGRTTFAIAHRLSTLRHASRLVILEKGEIDEIGTHDELIEADGTYARLCRLQTEMMQRKAW